MESVGPPTMWQGMNIRDILEKVELFNMAVAGEEVKDNSEKKINPSNVKSVIKVPDPSSAYLGKGPKLWDKTISLPIVEGEEDDEGVVGAVMNLEEFLAENDLKPSVDSRGLSNKEYEKSMSPNPQDVKPLPRPSIIVAPKRPAEPSRSSHESAEPSRSSSDDVGGNLLKGENNFLYAESKRARMEREKEERRKKFEAEVEFAEEDIALATIPGVDFDPRERTFDAEELRPQPIIQKRQKLFVPDLEKDGKYWDKRTKNNVAARRSREARRLKENQIALRAAYLEKENKVLRKELDETQFDGTKLETERDILKMKLSKYEAFADR